MWIGYLEIEIYLPDVTSLKEKRMIVKSIKDRVRSRYNICIAEIDENDKWQRAIFGIVGVNNSKQEINSLLDKILDWFEDLPKIEILEYSYRFFS